MIIEKKSVLWNTLFLSGGALARRIFAFGSMLLVTRYLGPAEYGRYIFVVTFVGFAATFWNFGLNIVYVRDVSADPPSAPRYLGGVLLAKTILTLLSAPFFYLTFFLMAQDPSVLMPTVIFSLATYLWALQGVFSSVFSQHRRMDLSSYLGFFQGLFTLILFYICVKMNGRIFHFFLAHLGISLLLLVASTWISMSFFTLPSFRVDLHFVWQLCRDGLPLLMTAMANLTLFKIDHLILAKLSEARVLGLYGAAYTIFEIVMALLPMLFMTAAFPTLSEEFKKESETFSHLTRITIKYFFILGIPITAGSIFLGDRIVFALYGSQFHEAGLVFSMLGSGIWCFFLTIPLSWILTAMHQQKIVLISNVVGLAVNVFLNLMLIPRYGAYAAAGTTVLCEIVQLAIMGRAVVKVISLGVNVYIWRVLLGTAVMCVLVGLLMMQGDFVNQSAWLALIIGTSGVLFGWVCYLLGILDRNELRILTRR